METKLGQLLDTTNDLLYRVRIYDRDLRFCDEILQLDRAYELAQAVVNLDNDKLQRKAFERLQEMRVRLLTMMEDLLFTA